MAESNPIGLRLALSRFPDETERLLDDVLVRVGRRDRVLREPTFVDARSGEPVELVDAWERIDRHAVHRSVLVRLVRRARNEDRPGEVR